MDMDFLKEKKALITGGTSGIGMEVARSLGELGCNVVVVGRDAQKLLDVQRTLGHGQGNGRLTAVQYDLADMEGTMEWCNDMWERYGPFDVLINNVGLGFDSVIDADPTDLDYLIRTNLTSYMALAGIFGQKMIDRRKPADILQISSMSASTKEANSSAYVASKSGVSGFTEALRKELNPHGIRVTLIEPGAVATPMQEIPEGEKEDLVDKQEMLRPQDIAGIVTFILLQPPRVNMPVVLIKPLMQVI